MANIFRVYKDSQVTTDRIRAEAAADSIVTPARVVYVFGTADDVAPNFTTVAGAITYANSLTPIVTEPVVVRLFTKADGTPYDLAGLSSWTTYANSYIYFVSDFVRLNETTTLPTTLPSGQQVWYIDPNGVETLWVGREDGSAWPAVGYKEFVAGCSISTTSAPQITRVDANTLGTVTTSGTAGEYAFTFSAFGALPFGSLKVLAVGMLSQSYVVSEGAGTKYFITGSGAGITQSTDVGRFNVVLYNTSGSVVSPDSSVSLTVSIKYYGLKP